MKVNVDKDKCIGCGLCVAVCPEIFEMDGDVAVAKSHAEPAAIEISCREARDGCPVEAITITDATE